LALASKTSNAKPYAIRGRFSHRKRDGIRKKPGFSGLFAVSGYRRTGFRVKIPQRNRALFKKLPCFTIPIRGGETAREAKNHAIARSDGIVATLLVRSSAVVLAAPALALSGARRPSAAIAPSACSGVM
jgi:hypothetical protein